MLSFAKKLYSLLIIIGNFLQSFVLLAMRLFWGWEFFIAGRDKLANIGPVSEYFESLGILLPTVNAYFAATIECVGGACLLIGLASRLVSVPLIVVMTVALLTAHHEAVFNIIEDPQNFVQQLPFTFLLASVIIFVFGPGGFSIDAALKHLFFKQDVRRTGE